ncbi:MAG: NAD-binding protein [Pseudomonadota bacterium]
MRIVIVGGSKFGVATSELLIEKGHDVVLIDRDRAKLERLSEQLDCGMVEGDGTAPTLLRDVHTSEDDVLIALTNASDDNILSALVARSVGFARVIPQIISPELLEVCAELDLTDTITPHATVARSICRALEEDTEVAEDLNLSHNLRLKRIEVPKSLDGTCLKDIGAPEGANPVAYIDGEDERIATPDLAVRAGAYVLFVLPVSDVEKLEESFSD